MCVGWAASVKELSLRDRAQAGREKNIDQATSQSHSLMGTARNAVTAPPLIPPEARPTCESATALHPPQPWRPAAPATPFRRSKLCLELGEAARLTGSTRSEQHDADPKHRPPPEPQQTPPPIHAAARRSSYALRPWLPFLKLPQRLAPALQLPAAHVLECIPQREREQGCDAGAGPGPAGRVPAYQR